MVNPSILKTDPQLQFGIVKKWRIRYRAFPRKRSQSKAIIGFESIGLLASKVWVLTFWDAFEVI
jgi:hypothetical protein